MTCARRGTVGIALLIASFPAVAQQKAPTEQELKAKGARQMTGAEISTSRVGSTWYYLHIPSGGVFPIYYRDGRTRILGKRVTLWWIDSADRACDESGDPTLGHRCGKAYLLNNQIHMCPDNEQTCIWTVRRMPGNPENL